MNLARMIDDDAALEILQGNERMRPRNKQRFDDERTAREQKKSRAKQERPTREVGQAA